MNHVIYTTNNNQRLYVSKESKDLGELTNDIAKAKQFETWNIASKFITEHCARDIFLFSPMKLPQPVFSVITVTENNDQQFACPYRDRNEVANHILSRIQYSCNIREFIIVYTAVDHFKMDHLTTLNQVADFLNDYEIQIDVDSEMFQNSMIHKS